MAGICCGVVAENEAAAAVESRSRASRRRRLELRLVSDVSVPPSTILDIAPAKRKKPELFPIPISRDCGNAVENCKRIEENKNNSISDSSKPESVNLKEALKFGMTSVCGRRRDMEDAVSIHTSYTTKNTSYFGVFDGHGCSHVAMKCRDRLHEIVKQEVEGFKEEESVEWKETMERSFVKMDKEVGNWCVEGENSSSCRCGLQTPQGDAVGSTAVVAVVTPEKIIVSNCGDSRAVLCRNGVAIPLSSDHKPDRPDELLRIQEAGGRVIYWDGPRVLGVLAMSRAIGDNYLKPYVIPEPEVTVTERMEEDECLILASDGLWDVVSNDTACGVVRMCLRAQKPPSPPGSNGALGSSDKACSDASALLTKLALARHSTDNISVVVVDLRRNQH
ncbi:hypothetical protein D5086_015915 [Populus alba]|uniref:Uncharacterized protein n=2 Tax=Populus alba TaxID=43335 RepID=A0ACC4BUK3_POPAL|nr:protein phosphatase 2C 37-like [Populus alba]TKS17629.1 protein phosphatase 2C 37-like [Populus alba]